MADITRSGTEALPLPPWRLNATLFVATVASVFATQLVFNKSAADAAAAQAGLLAKAIAFVSARDALMEAGAFTLTLLGILSAHELGHFAASRIHRVEASLPFFIPLPVISPFGTMGAVIRMRGAIASRRALLDIGAAGPLAGLAVALPLYAYGAARSKVVPIERGADAGVELGESLVVKLLDVLAHPSLPAGSELYLSPVAFGAWAGMFVTMVNLLPVGQLDGGHVAYALFGRRQDTFARWIHRGLFGVFFARLAYLVAIDVSHGLGLSRFGIDLGSSLFWLVWFQILAILGTLSMRDEPRPEGSLSVGHRVAATFLLVVSAGYLRTRDDMPIFVVKIGVWPAYVAWFALLGALVFLEVKRGVFRDPDLLAHPRTSEEPLDLPRKVVAIVTLAFFVGLFMPTPIAM